ncbi:MAG: hypothetical protein SF187_22445 [Deltaproteobacteria bacterium]|nr:hypothetical protein [Deltaproteobacteria bacterium]
MIRQVTVIAVSLAVAACGGGGNDPGGGSDAGFDVGAGGTGGGTPTIAIDVNETAVPVAAMVTPENGGTIRSASGLLELIIPKGAVAEPVLLSVVRLRGTDVPSNAMGGIAHTIEPKPAYFNAVATAIWTIPAATAKAAFGTSENRFAWPLPIMGYQKSNTIQPLGVRKIERFEDGGLRVTSYASSPPAAIYLSTDHAVVTTMTVNPTQGEPGSFNFTVSPTAGSMITWVSGSISSTSTNNWISGGNAVEPNGVGGLTGYFRGRCGQGRNTAAISFEVKTKIKVGLHDLEYNAWMGGGIACPI